MKIFETKVGSIIYNGWSVRTEICFVEKWLEIILYFYSRGEAMAIDALYWIIVWSVQRKSRHSILCGCSPKIFCSVVCLLIFKTRDSRGQTNTRIAPRIEMSVKSNFSASLNQKVTSTILIGKESIR